MTDSYGTGEVLSGGFLALLCTTAIQLFGLSGLLFAFQVDTTATVPEHCDPAVLRYALSGPIGYRLQTDRCEGHYRQQASAGGLTVASLLTNCEDYDPTDNTPLILRWDAADGPVKLRGISMRSNTLYRMDRKCKPDEDSFSWPTDFLAWQRFRKSELGIKAFQIRTLCGSEVEVLIPLSITQGGSALEKGGYRLVLWPGIALQKVCMSIAPVDQDGCRGKYIFSGPLEQKLYPAERPIVQEIPDLPKTGLYAVDIEASTRQGWLTTANFYFQHLDSRP